MRVPAVQHNHGLTPRSLELINTLILRLDGTLQKVQTMWHNMFVDMKSLLSWQYLMRDIQIIKTWNITMVTTTKRNGQTGVLTFFIFLNCNITE